MPAGKSEDRAPYMARRSEIVEATLGFGLGIPAMIFGCWVLTGGYAISSALNPRLTHVLLDQTFSVYSASL
ncbi:hypothetical protein AUI06_02075 [archaeon 13_2_20CM_2_52_21]|nr:MAG: hypothetical protein AUI06_02075 [archaeon 13_2_20CM_2_52_21]